MEFIKKSVVIKKSTDENFYLSNEERNIYSPNIPNELKYYIDGLVLGDGSINSLSPYYEHNTISLEWLSKIKNFFEKYKIKCKIDKIKNRNLYKLRCASYKFFENFRNRWYKEKEDSDFYRFKYEKLLPNDLDLMPVTVANWYMGDGSLLNPTPSHKQYAIKLSTHSFNYNDVHTLKNCLNSFLHTKFTVITETKYKSNEDCYYTLRLYGNDNVKLFLDYIKPYIINDYSYKYEPFYNFMGE